MSEKVLLSTDDAGTVFVEKPWGRVSRAAR
jgi:hypothetical protein